MGDAGKIQDAINRLFYELTLNELREMNGSSLYPNISHNSLLYLDLIYYTEGCTASLLADMLHISKPAVTAKVNELIKQGLVSKTQSDGDKRVYYLSVSPEVRAENRRYDTYMHHAIDALKQQYTPAQLATLCDMLDLMREKYLEKARQ